MVNSATGNGIAGVTVDLIWSGEMAYSTTTGAQGRFRIENVQDGAYMARYSSPDYSWTRDPGAPRQFQVTAGGSPVKLEARMTPLARVSGRVVDGRGEAVPGAVVSLSGPESAMSARAARTWCGSVCFGSSVVSMSTPYPVQCQRMKATRGPSRRRSANAPCRFDQSMAV